MWNSIYSFWKLNGKKCHNNVSGVHYLKMLFYFNRFCGIFILSSHNCLFCAPHNFDATHAICHHSAVCYLSSVRPIQVIETTIIVIIINSNGSVMLLQIFVAGSWDTHIPTYKHSRIQVNHLQTKKKTNNCTFALCCCCWWRSDWLELWVGLAGWPGLWSLKRFEMKCYVYISAIKCGLKAKI